VDDIQSTLRGVSTVCPCLVRLARTALHVNVSGSSAQLCRRSPTVSSTAASSRQKARRTSFCNPPIDFSEDEHLRPALLTTDVGFRRNLLPDRSSSRESAHGERATLLLPAALSSVGHKASASANVPSPPPRSSHPGGQASHDLGLDSFSRKTRDGSAGFRIEDASIVRAPRQGVPRSTPSPESPGSQRFSRVGVFPLARSVSPYV